MGVGAGLYMCDVVKKVHVRYLISWWVLVCLCQYSYDDFPLTVHINCDWQCLCVYLPMRWGYETVLRVETYFDFQYEHLLFYSSFIPDLVLVSLSTATALMLFIIARSSVVFSERELTFTFAICYRPSVCLSSVCLSSVCLSVTFVRPTQAAQIFGNISTALGTLAIRGHPLKILQRSSQGNPSAGGVKDKRGSQI